MLYWSDQCLSEETVCVEGGKPWPELQQKLILENCFDKVFYTYIFFEIIHHGLDCGLHLVLEVLDDDVHRGPHLVLEIINNRPGVRHFMKIVNCIVTFHMFHYSPDDVRGIPARLDILHNRLHSWPHLRYYSQTHFKIGKPWPDLWCRPQHSWRQAWPCLRCPK